MTCFSVRRARVSASERVKLLEVAVSNHHASSCGLEACAHTCGTRSPAPPGRLLSRIRWPLRRSGRKCLMARRGTCDISSVFVDDSLLDQEHSQRRSVLIPATDEQRHTKWPGHYALLTLRTLTESQREIAYALCAALDGQRLSVVEGMRLRRDSASLSAFLTLPPLPLLFQHTAHARQAFCCQPANLKWRSRCACRSPQSSLLSSSPAVCLSLSFPHLAPHPHPFECRLPWIRA